ncbi:amino acid permease [Actinomadura barringtoniae]|nr:amino acid permease [Actinomadura barringtoniae]
MPELPEPPRKRPKGFEETAEGARRAAAGARKAAEGAREVAGGLGEMTAGAGHVAVDAARQLPPPSPEDEGYQQSLKPRHVRMIAMGGAIGVGLFLGSAQRLQNAGPGLVLAYLAAGIAALFVMRALGELVLWKPTSGSFVTYARDFIGPWAGFASGWMYWLNWAMTGVAETTAVGMYVHYWAPDFPQWISAAIALAVLLAVNLVSVRLFGELEFWFAMLKVAALVAFLVVGCFLVATHAKIGDYHAQFSNLTDYGGFFPRGFWMVLLSLQGVIFAYAAIEMVGISAGEAENPRKVMPGAINGVVWRIALFYVGAIFLLVVVLPWTVYRSGESPFVTVFSALGVPGIGSIMNIVVITAALSGTNSGLYSTGRVLRSLSQRGEAPEFVGRMSSHHVPYGGILFTSAVYLAGIALNIWVPHSAFDIATSIASLGVLTTWATLLYAQIRLRRRAMQGEIQRPDYRMPGSPYTNWITLGFLAFVVFLMGFDSNQKWAVIAIPFLVVGLWAGWRFVKNRSAAAAAALRPPAPPR